MVMDVRSGRVTDRRQTATAELIRGRLLLTAALGQPACVVRPPGAGAGLCAPEPILRVLRAVLGHLISRLLVSGRIHHSGDMPAGGQDEPLVAGEQPLVPAGLRMRSWALHEPPIERPEYQDNADVYYQPLPEVVPEEQDVHADHDGHHREHVKHVGCLSSHRFLLLRATERSKRVRRPWVAVPARRHRHLSVSGIEVSQR